MTGAFIVPRLQQLNANARSLPLNKSLTEPGAVANVPAPTKPPKNLLAKTAARLGASATGMVRIMNSAVDTR